jgi:Domain of unknown function (DUF4345)
MKSERFVSVVLGLGALIMLAISVIGTLAPGQIVGPIGITASGAAGLSELRSGYGSHLGFAGLFAYGAANARFRSVAVNVEACLFLSIVSSRLLSFSLDGVGQETFKALSVEGLLAILSIAAAWACRGAVSSSPSGAMTARA